MVKVVLEWNGLKRHLDLPAVPEKGEQLTVASAKLADPEHGLALTVATRRWKINRHGNLDSVTLQCLGGGQLPKPVADEERRWLDEWVAAGWLGTVADIGKG